MVRGGQVQWVNNHGTKPVYTDTVVYIQGRGWKVTISFFLFFKFLYLY